jgi:phosphoribosylcarboxyaminoimidazole (NCAIR) mutase
VASFASCLIAASETLSPPDPSTVSAWRNSDRLRCEAGSEAGVDGVAAVVGIGVAVAVVGVVASFVGVAVVVGVLDFVGVDTVETILNNKQGVNISNIYIKSNSYSETPLVFALSAGSGCFLENELALLEKSAKTTTDTRTRVFQFLEALESQTGCSYQQWGQSKEVGNW